jgi:hypothetical protein
MENVPFFGGDDLGNTRETAKCGIVKNAVPVPLRWIAIVGRNGGMPTRVPRVVRDMAGLHRVLTSCDFDCPSRKNQLALSEQIPDYATDDALSQARFLAHYRDQLRQLVMLTVLSNGGANREVAEMPSMSTATSCSFRGLGCLSSHPA